MSTAVLWASSNHGLVLKDAVLNFDARHYYTIAQSGYNGFLQAFFPLFPLTWRAIGIGPISMCIVNGLIYLVSLAILQRELQASLKTFMFWLVVPSAFFFWLPYSESLFFLGSTLLLIGTKRSDIKLSSIGLFLCTLSRPAFTVLVPALLLTELSNVPSRSHFLSRMTAYILITCAGLALVAFIQWFDTGEWLGFYHAQEGWGNRFRMPSLPLTSWGGSPSVRLDAVAFLTGAAAGIVLLWNIFKERGNLRFPKELTLSLFYLAGISTFVFLMRGGELFSLNRFVFATPYFLIALNYIHYITLNTKQLVFLGIGAFTFFLLFGSFLHIQTLLSYLLITIYLMMSAFTLIRQLSSKTTIVMYLTLVLTLGLQIYYFLRFLKGGWVA